MTVFQYTAENPEGKKVRGTIEAQDATSARSALENMQYRVDAVSEPSRSNHAQEPAPLHMSGTAFVFEGKDPKGVLKKGTIQAASKREAFDKLVQEQSLALTRLSPLGSTPPPSDPDLAAWSASKVQEQSTRASRASEEPARYHPLLSTLRLYAAWLLAWYGLFIALGYYVSVRSLPWDIPFVSAFSGSHLVFGFVTAIFSFLLLSTLHKTLKGTTLLGAAFGILWVLIILGSRAVNV